MGVGVGVSGGVYLEEFQRRGKGASRGAYYKCFNHSIMMALFPCVRINRTMAQTKNQVQLQSIAYNNAHDSNSR